MSHAVLYLPGWTGCEDKLINICEAFDIQSDYISDLPTSNIIALSVPYMVSDLETMRFMNSHQETN